MLGGIRIRPAMEADGATIRAMARAARLIPRGLYWSRFLVAEEGGRVVGIWQIKVHKGGTRELASGAVLPEYRRRGIGAKLIRALLARERGPLYLRCNEKWAHYYEQFGFRRVKPSGLPSDFRRDYWMARIISAVPFFLLRRSVRIIPMERDPRRSALRSRRTDAHETGEREELSKTTHLSNRKMADFCNVRAEDTGLFST